MTDKPASDSPVTGSWTDRVTDRVMRLLIGAALRLPYAVRVAGFGKLVRWGIAPLAGYTKRSRANLAMIWPDRAQAERERIARQVSENVGRVVIENYAPEEFAERARRFEIGGAGWAALKEAHAQGKRVLAVSAHYGNYEAARAALHHRGISFGGVYRPMRNAFFNAHYVKTVEAVAGPVFPTEGRGMVGFVRALAKGQPMMLLNDLNIYSGIKLPFLGHPANTAISAAEMALRYDAVLFPIYGVRCGDDPLCYHVVVEPPVPPSTPEAMTGALNRSLEALVRQDPAQWFWIHRRWK